MVSRVSPAAFVTVALLLAFAVGPAAGHEGGEGAGIACEPSQVTAGGTVVLSGTGLEPDSTRQINLVGPDVIVPLGSVTTDAEGMFAITLTVPAHLPGGAYTFQAIGDETLTTSLGVTAAAGQATPAPDGGPVAIVARDRSPLEIGAWALLIVVALTAGAFLIWRAEGLAGSSDRALPS